MNDERLKQAFDKMTPDTQSEKRMLAEILRKGESYMDRKFTVEPVKPSRWAAIPAVMAILAMIALSVFVAVRFDRNRNTANDPTQEHDTVPNRITEPDTHLDSEVPQNHEDSPEPMTIPSYGERPPEEVWWFPTPVDINDIQNCSVRASVLSATDSIYGYEIEVEVTVFDTYDAEYISTLQVGDTIVIASQPVVIITLEYSENAVVINGDAQGETYYLRSEESRYEGRYAVTPVLDGPSGIYDCVLTLPVSENFIFTDDSDPKNPGAVYTFKDLVYDESLREAGFTQNNTTIAIEDGVVTQMHRN